MLRPTFCVPPSPVPVAATYTVATTCFCVTFDRPLSAATVDPTNWLFNTPAGGRGGLAPVVAAGCTVSGPTAVGVVLGPPNTCRYTPPPFDVLSSTGVPACRFVDFPVTIL